MFFKEILGLESWVLEIQSHKDLPVGEKQTIEKETNQQVWRLETLLIKRGRELERNERDATLEKRTSSRSGCLFFICLGVFPHLFIIFIHMY